MSGAPREPAAPDARASTLTNITLERLRHDLHMPINAMIGHAEMLIEDLDEDVGPEIRDGLRRYLQTGARLLDRLNRIFAAGSGGADLITVQDRLREELATDVDEAIAEIRPLIRRAEAEGRRVLTVDMHRIREAGDTLLAQLRDLSIDDGAATAGTARRRRPDDATPRSAYAGAHVLVAEDVAVNRDLFQRRLERDGFRVTLAPTGTAALEAMRSAQPDVVLLDISMPELGGPAVLQRMKDDPELRRLPVIMIPSPDEIEDAARCIELGADDYFPKDFHPALLRARIDGILEKKRLRSEERMYLDAVRRELELGRYIQRDFLPDTLPQPEGWEVAAHFQPAHDVAGDFYDVFRLDDGRIVLVVADVSDKGIGAALFMALIRTLVRALALEATRDRVDPIVAVRQVNDYITSHHQTNAVMFATMFVGVLDPPSGRLVYVNAGHCPPIIAGPRGLHGQLDPTGPSVGILPDFDFQKDERVLQPGETLFMYTDGVTEAQDADCSCFSDDRLHKLLTEPAATAEALIRRVDDRIREFVGKVPDFDDITMLVVRRQDPSIRSS